ncbi:cation:proton antiporter [Sphingomonas sp.]|uniref:cation:proton antiporter domain-containing protein n=1 Tax=Sphingomonas sp. TaxID=28214 RepID=UPI002DE55BE5|nr:cation:proton antiporter [Sphingomonas sp.]HEV2569506.1 cation:proton antiporter [Sphingomonas sp.]
MAFTLNSTGFSDALVILGAAGIVIPAFARVRVNPVIGFILVGALVGPFGLGQLVPQAPWLYYLTISDPDAIEPFAELGIVLLLFAIGLELSLKRLWDMRALVFGVGAAELALSGALIGAALLALGQPWTGAFGLGLALALSSTALVLPMTGIHGPVGRPAFAMLLFEDVALVPIIFILGALGGSATLASLGSTVALGFAVIVALLIAGRFLLPRLFAQAARAKNPELFLAASLLAVIVASLATSAAGLSPIVGALIAGLSIAETDYRGEVESITAPFRGLALGVFLITVGMSLDLGSIAANWQSLVMAVVGVMLVKTLVTFLLLRVIKTTRGAALQTGILMASPSETTLIVLGAASAAGLISAGTAAFWQTVTAIGLTLTPLLARVAKDLARRLEHGADEPPEQANIGTVIIGFGRVGRMVADLLRAHNKPFTAVESDIDAVAAARKDGYNVLFGDASRPDFIDRLRLGHAEALVLTMDDPVLSVRLTRRVRGWVPDLTIVARARDTDHAAELYRAGVTDAVPETLESSLQLSEAVLVDLGVAMGPVIASIHGKRDELRKEIKQAGALDREPRLARTRLQDLNEAKSL